MRNLLLAPFLLSLALAALPACDDDDINGLDEADIAAADGEFLGQEHARQIDNEIVGDTDDVVIAKSAAIMIAIDENEILLADFALQTALDPVVLDYAQFMIDEHTEHLEEVDDLLFDFDLAPIESSVSDALRSEADGVLRGLQIALDVDFEYMRSQIVMHAEAFVIVDTLALRSPFNEWTVFFDNTALMIDDHRVDAELILRGL